MVPTAGFRLQVTAVLMVPVRVGVNCWAWDPIKDTGVGAIEIVMPATARPKGVAPATFLAAAS